LLIYILSKVEDQLMINGMHIKNIHTDYDLLLITELS